ncbi:MAG: formimidoylglutamase [Flavobacterium sp.]|nr:formimidoylglutamase [Flavobacterium sp.]
MEKLIRCGAADLAKLTNHRSGEIKFGEKMQTIAKDSDVNAFLATTDAEYVLFGIPEDVGVRANYGRPGTASAWEAALRNICNIQHNRYCKGSRIAVLGHLDIESQMTEANILDTGNILDRKKLATLVESIDKEVSHLVSLIVKAGKIPIIIGGGHNNSYGNIKGSALARGKHINAVNFDAHTDLRMLEGRHSGNGFTYAFEEGFLKKYFIFGLHESYTPKSVLDRLKTEDRIRFNSYDEIAIRNDRNFDAEMAAAFDFIKHDPYGIEIDLDAIPGIASSAMTISGFSVEQLRRFVTYFAKHENVLYLHICEGAPDLDSKEHSNLVGKLIAYLVTDFIKSNSHF